MAPEPSDPPQASPPPSPGPAAAGVAERPPALAAGVQLIGQYEGSGFRDPPLLVRRADGQVIQLPELLYKLAAKADGRRSYEQIAAELTEEIRRGVDADSVRFLVEEKLRPLGVMAAADGSSPVTARSDPLLGFRLRAAVVPESVSNALGAAFRPLFLPVVVLAMLAAVVAVDVWLFGTHGVAQSVRETMYSPALFLPLFAAIVLSAAFHEIGHAAACRYGGGRPGKMGFGIYLAWPAFYTDVTDAYRLGRRARLRTDLGGIYFNAIVVVATVGAYAVTGFEPLLLLAVVQHFEMAHQLLPVVRLDGYYIVADATGVPDLFNRIRPILTSLLPGREPDERVRALKPWVRVAVTAWVLVVVPLLGFQLLLVLLHLPRILATGWDSAGRGWGAASDAFGAGDPLGGMANAVQLLILGVPTVGILLVLARTAHRSGRAVWRRTEGRPLARASALAVSGALGALLVSSWISPGNYTPIRPGERGTLAQGVRAVSQVRDLPAASAPEAAPEPEPTTTTTTVAGERPATTTPSPSTTVRVTTTAAVTSTTSPATTTTTVADPTTTVAE